MVEINNNNLKIDKSRDEQLQNIINKYFKDKNWDLNKLDLQISSSGSLINAYIKLDDWIINLKLNSSLEQDLENLLKIKANKTNILDSILYSTITHEKGHWDICPKDRVYLNRFISVAYKELKKHNQEFNTLDNEDKNKYIDTVLNLFEDIAVNLSNKNDKKFVEGYSFLYFNRLLENSQINKMFFAFVYSQINFLDKDMKSSLFDKFDVDYKTLNPISRKILGVFVGDEISCKVFNGQELTKYEIDESIKRIKNEENWEQMLKNFIKILNDNELIKKSDIVSINLLIGEQLVFKTKTTFEEFDHIYKKNAQDIIIKYNKPDYNIYLRKEFRDPNSINKMSIKNTFLINNKLNIPQKSILYNIPILNSINDLLFIVDVSGSMNWTGKPLDNSHYDTCIRSLYSIFAYLEKHSQNPQTKFGLITFSEYTKWTGWYDFNNLIKVKKGLFNDYQNSATSLNITTLNNAFNQSNKKFTTIIITDGDIFNETALIQFLEPKIISGEIIFFNINTDINHTNGLIKKFKELSPNKIYKITKPEDLLDKVINLNNKK